jgi:hypothetical protein
MRTSKLTASGRCRERFQAVSKGLGDIQQTVLWTCWVARDHDPFRRPVYLTLREIFLEAGNKDPTDLQLKSARRAVDLMAKDGTILKNYNKPKIRDDLPKGTLLVAAPRNASSRATTGEKAFVRSHGRERVQRVCRLGDRSSGHIRGARDP